MRDKKDLGEKADDVVAVMCAIGCTPIMITLIIIIALVRSCIGLD